MPKIIENLREDILEKTEEILEKNGFHVFSIRNLSKELGVAPATIYNYFENKEQIIGEVITSRWRLLLINVEMEIAKSQNTTETLIRMGKELQKFMQPMLTFWTLDEEKSDTLPKKEHLKEKKKMISKTLSMAITTLLIKDGFSEKEAREMAPSLGKLLILTSHDISADLFSMIQAVQKLGK